MKRILFLSSVISFTFLISPVLSRAAKSNEFIDALSRKIYADCKGEKVLVISGDSVLGGAIYATYLENGGSIELNKVIETEVSQHNVNTVVSALANHEPYTEYGQYPERPYRTSPEMERALKLTDGRNLQVSNDGLGILKCGDNTLDVNGYQYYW